MLCGRPGQRPHAWFVVAEKASYATSELESRTRKVLYLLLPQAILAVELALLQLAVLAFHPQL